MLLLVPCAADRKLALVVRHGQAVSNYLSEVLGPDEWFAVEGTCEYEDKNGTKYTVFDAGEITGRHVTGYLSVQHPLTPATALNACKDIHAMAINRLLKFHLCYCSGNKCQPRSTIDRPCKLVFGILHGCCK